jgi:all-trans-8'-apo-beta-carotenal 15,15'-oxygenase
LNDLSPFSAHPKIDRATGELFNFGVSFSDPPFLNFYRFDSGGHQKMRKRIPLPYPCSLHDFALSRRFAIFHLSPYLLDIKAFLLDRRSLFDSLEWRPHQEYRLLILDRNQGSVAASVPTDTGYCLHWINAFESGELLTLDFVEFERPIYDHYRPVPDLFHTAPIGRPVRCEVDISTMRIVRRRELDFTCAPDFPIIPPQFLGRACDRFWILGISATGAHGRKFFDRLARADWNTQTASDVYSTPPGHYLAGEPVYAGNPSDGSEAVVLCQMVDVVKQRSSFALFDASNLREGPVSTICLDRPIPPAFHAAFEPCASDAETFGL